MKINLNTIWFWFVRSSKDSKKWSLTLKAILAALIPIFTMFNVDLSSLPQGVDLLAKVVEQTWLLVASITAFIGFLRKLKTTVLGSNAVINDKIWQ